MKSNMKLSPRDKTTSFVPEYCQVLRFKDANGNIKEMVFPKGLDLDRPKRPRTTFSSTQLEILEKEFESNQYLVGKDRTRLAKELKLSENQIKVWFQNRRTKSKRDTSEPTDSNKSPDEESNQVMTSLNPIQLSSTQIQLESKTSVQSDKLDPTLPNPEHAYPFGLNPFCYPMMQLSEQPLLNQWFPGHIAPENAKMNIWGAQLNLLK